jgi:PleD family two-component response regulator
MSISFGVSCYNPVALCSIDELIANTDKMMYEQKRLKKKIVVQGCSTFCRSYQQVESYS